MIIDPNEPIHFSTLKKFALSAAHVNEALTGPEGEWTRAMKVGTIVHHLVLGPHTRKGLVRFDGDRRQGKVWDQCVADNPGKEIVTAPEWTDAEPMAKAVQRHELAMSLLAGRKEVELEWINAGVKCATHGIDVIGDGWLADLKTTTCTEPEAFQRHAFKLLYPQQMAFYKDAAEYHKIDTSKGLFLIGVESTAPYVVTCFKLTDALIEHGTKSIALWIEKLRAARENNFWPGYTQAIVDFDVPGWMGAGDDDE